MTFPVHHICAALHSRTNLYEMDVKHWLRNLAELKQSGFSLETTPLLQMTADAKALNALAAAILMQRDELTKPEKELKHA